MEVPLTQGPKVGAAGVDVKHRRPRFRAPALYRTHPACFVLPRPAGPARQADIRHTRCITIRTGSRACLPASRCDGSAYRYATKSVTQPRPRAGRKLRNLPRGRDGGGYVPGAPICALQLAFTRAAIPARLNTAPRETTDSDVRPVAVDARITPIRSGTFWGLESRSARCRGARHFFPTPASPREPQDRPGCRSGTVRRGTDQRAPAVPAARCLVHQRSSPAAIIEYGTATS